jgi:hypothetical protein
MRNRPFLLNVPKNQERCNGEAAKPPAAGNRTVFLDIMPFWCPGHLHAGSKSSIV